MANLAIKGHATRGKEVIEILEMLGGKNRHEYVTDSDCFGFFIGNETTNKTIYYDWLWSFYDEDVIFTLEEFLEKFPYKVGDRVRVPEYESEVYISKMFWDGNEVQYEVVTDEVEWYSAKELNKFNEPNKEETTEKEKNDWAKWDLPEGYEFQDKEGNVINTDVIKLVKKQSHYPKTYEECCDVLEIKYSSYCVGYQEELLDNFQQLIVCRDAYWKIAGWNPKVKSDVFYMNTLPSYLRDLFPMPTEEMRDVFYENFKDLIIECVELL